MIQREIVVRLALEVLQHLRVAAIDPTCRRDIDGFELTFDLVLVTQSMRDDVEL